MLELSGQRLTLEQIDAVASDRLDVALAATARERVRASREVINGVLREGRVIYGVNTGFGKLSDVHISPAELETLQLNLVRSHCCGLGTPLSKRETRAVMLLRANVLARGNSGCRDVVIDTLLAMLKNGVHPVIPEKGSVGASGDLAPLAHLALGLIGEGESRCNGQQRPSVEVLRETGIAPLRLAAKEGLALLNGTQAMAAVGGLAIFRAQRVTALADLAGAMTLEALLGTPSAFDARIHEVRPQEGQIASAAHLRQLLEGSEIRHSHLAQRSSSAGCLQSALHAAGSRGGARGASACPRNCRMRNGLGDRQSAGI